MNTKIPKEVIDRIYEAAHIEDVVGEYVTLKKRGSNLIGLCPFHDEKTGSFTVSPSKGIYKCFGCGVSGHSVKFIMDIEKCSYPEALRFLAKKYHIEVPEREMTPDEIQRQNDRESMDALNEFAAKWFEDQLWNTPEGQAVGLSYLRQRGLTDAMIHQFRIGYSPDKSKLSSELVNQNFQEKYILNDSEHAPYIGTGLCIKSQDGRLFDRFHSRVIFPFFTQSGKVIGFAGRLLVQKDNVGKYVNSPTSLIFEKHNQLFGIYQAGKHISRLQRCYLVEGQMDVISMQQAGIANVVASGGTSLTKPQIKLIHRLTDNITILYDGDKAGIKAALRGIDMILEEGINVKVVLLPEGEDPDSYARSHNASDFIEFIEKNQTDFIRFKTILLSDEAGNDPIQRRDLLASVVISIASIPDAITRQVYIQDCSHLLHISEQILIDQINKYRQGQKLSTGIQPPISTTYSPSSLEENLLNLIRLMVRYGEKPLYSNDSGEPISVGEYILRELNSADIHPVDAIQKRMLDEYQSHYQDSGFVANNFFMRHMDSEISNLAVNLISDQYQLSTLFNKRAISENVVEEINPERELDLLPDITERLLLEVKFSVINQRILAIQEMLKMAKEQNDWTTIQMILSEQPRLMAIRTEIGKALGDRVFPSYK